MIKNAYGELGVYESGEVLQLTPGGGEKGGRGCVLSGVMVWTTRAGSVPDCWLLVVRGTESWELPT